VLVIAQQRRIGLQQMEVSIHGLLFVLIHLAQTLIDGQGPIALVGLEVAAIGRIVSEASITSTSARPGQYLRVAGGVVILASA